MARVFVRGKGTVHHFWSSELLLAPLEPGQGPRHVDFIWPLWAIVDRTPEGRGSDWCRNSGTATRRSSSAWRRAGGHAHPGGRPAQAVERPDGDQGQQTERHQPHHHDERGGGHCAEPVDSG
jgi:hypothetical protein